MLQNSLANAGNPARLVADLSKVEVDPSRVIEGRVAAIREEVVGGDGLGVSSALEHEKLRHNGNYLQPTKRRGGGQVQPMVQREIPIVSEGEGKGLAS